MCVCDAKEEEEEGGAREGETHPNSVSAVHERRCEPAPIVDATCGDNEDGTASQRRLLALAQIDDLGDKEGSGDVSGLWRVERVVVLAEGVR